MKPKTLATRGLEVLALAMIGEGIVGLAPPSALLALLENRPALGTRNRGDLRATSRSHAADMPWRNRSRPLDRAS